MNRIELLEDYEALRDRVGTVALPSWSLIELRGTDRARLLNTLGTNRLDGLTPGHGRETFLTDAKGRVVAHGIVLAGGESEYLLSAATQSDTIAAHINRYIVREDVQVFDRSNQTATWYVGGCQANALLENLEIRVPHQLYDHGSGERDGVPITVCRVEMTGPTGFLLITRRDHAGTVKQMLARSGARVCAREAFEALRIEWGWPLDRIDISLNNFPQEVGRDDETISFTKGCYLGQETVARIASRGHVNQRLVLLQFLPGKHAASATLCVDGKGVGVTTSVTYSPKLNRPIALAYVHCQWAEPGTCVESTIGPAEIILPRRQEQTS